VVQAAFPVGQNHNSTKTVGLPYLQVLPVLFAVL
jgi:hypothetical protein